MTLVTLVVVLSVLSLGFSAVGLFIDDVLPFVVAVVLGLLACAYAFGVVTV